MNKKQFDRLKRTYKGQREFCARDAGYKFDLFDDSWTLSYKWTMYLEWMYELEFDEPTFLDLRLSLAHVAKSLSSSSMIQISYSLKSVSAYIDPSVFEAWWITLNNVNKIHVKNALGSICSRYSSKTLQPLYDVLKDVSSPRRFRTSSNIFNSKKGAYSEIELDNIQEALRFETTSCLSKSVESALQFNRYRNVIASQLLCATSRRLAQLCQIKWCDVLPIGTPFCTPKEVNRNWVPLTQHMFSDIEQLHLRTFKGKDGEFRCNAESFSHRLEPNFSKLILRYFQTYQNFLNCQLNKKGVVLDGDEISEIMTRLPILPASSLFFSDFISKKHIFNAVSITSEAYHLRPDALKSNIDNLFKNLNPVSDRHPTQALKLSNNRWRHYRLTQAAKWGLSPAQISMITGVTVEAIAPYLDLNIPERVMVDEAYAGNHIIKLFDSIAVSELQKKPGFIVKNEFDEEIGHKLNPHNCSSCQSRGGAPMSCYPCNNFRPLETANHQQYLEKAEYKLKKNSQSGHQATTDKLKKIITFIKATIDECNKRKTVKLENL